jgi:hypothetical protein
LAGFTPQNEPLLRRIAADPKGWTLDAPTEIQEGAAWYGRLNSLFSADDISEIIMYHRVRLTVQQIQADCDIPSCDLVYKTIRGVQVNYMDRHDQLIMLPVDYEILKFHAPGVARQFFRVVQLDYSYDLHRLSEEEEALPTTYNQVAELAQVAVYASLGTESFNWEPTPDGGWRGSYVFDREHPDKITLYLAMAWKDGEPTDYVTFEAMHPDPSRFPWRASR